ARAFANNRGGMNPGQWRFRRGQRRNRARKRGPRRGGANQRAPFARKIHGYDEAAGRSRLFGCFTISDEREIRWASRFERRDARNLYIAVALECEIQPLCQLSDAHAL